MTFNLDECGVPLLVAAVVAAVGWFALSRRSAPGTPAAAAEATSGGPLSMLSGLLSGNRALILSVAFTLFQHRREMVAAIGQGWGAVWPLLVKLFGPNPPASAPPTDPSKV